MPKLQMGPSIGQGGAGGDRAQDGWTTNIQLNQTRERTRTEPPTERIAYLMLTMTMALWGSAFAASKIIVTAVPFQVAALLRFGLGAAVIMLWLLVARTRLDLSTRDWGRIVLAGALGVFGYNTFFFWGLSLAPSIDGSVIVPVFSPVLTTAAAVLFLHDRAAPTRVVGLALGMAGMAVFLVGSGGYDGGQRLLGDLVYLLGAMSWAAYTLLGKRILTGIEPLKATALAMLVGSVMLAALAVPVVPGVAWRDLPADFWPIMTYLVIGPTVVAYVFYYRGVRAVGPVSASVMMFLVPGLGVAGGVLVLHESLAWPQWAGAGLMLMGALLAVTQGRLRLSSTAPARCADDQPARLGSGTRRVPHNR